MAIYPYLDSDDMFIKDLKEGFYYQFIVAVELLKLGFWVYLPKLGIRPNFNNRKGFTDKGDILIMLDKDSKILNIEIKSRDLAFTNIKDYPFDTIIVDEIFSFEKKERPDFFIFISKKTNSKIVLSGKTFKHWKKESKISNKKKTQKIYYITKVDHLRSWDYFISWLKENGIKKKDFFSSWTR